MLTRDLAGASGNDNHASFLHEGGRVHYIPWSAPLRQETHFAIFSAPGQRAYFDILAGRRSLKRHQWDYREP